MARVSSLLLAAALGLVTLSAAPAPPSPAHAAAAPADEYFGPLKWSALEIRHRIDALGRVYRRRWADDASILHDAGLVLEAYHAWAARYPRDPWLAPTLFHIAELDADVQTPAAQQQALAIFKQVAQRFPDTHQGHLARLRLAQGPPPPHAEPPVQPTPNPYAPSPSPAPSMAPPTAVPAPLLGPSASPAPSASPVPAPSASPAQTPSARASPGAPAPQN